MFAIALASGPNGFLVGMALAGLGFGMCMAVDLALVVDVLPNRATAAKDLGVFNLAGALPFSIAPALAPAVLAVGGGSYAVLYAVAGFCAIAGAAAILPVKRVRCAPVAVGRLPGALLPVSVRGPTTRQPKPRHR